MGRKPHTESMALLCKQKLWDLCQNKSSMQLSKKRSIGPATLEPPTYNVGQRVGPPNVRSVVANTTKEIQDAKTKNLIRFLA